MWPYWLLFSVAAWLSFQRVEGQPSEVNLGNRWPLAWVLCFTLLTLGVGLRNEVGGDWRPYQIYVDNATGDTLRGIADAGLTDFSYAYLSWIGGNSFGGIYLVNLVCAILFVWGLLVFCRMQPRAWLAFLVAVPYLITVVAMGYTRQGVAIGIAMLGLSALNKGSVVRFVFWISFAMTFHKSALVLVPLAIFSRSHYRLLTLFGVFLATGLLFVLLVQEAVNNLVINYVIAEAESAGAAIRVAMNALPAAIFLLYHKKFLLNESEEKLWTWFSIGGLLFVVLLFASPSSTAVDRLALYWIPLQLFVWSRLPDAMGRSPKSVRRWVFVVFLYCFAVHFVWLFFSPYSAYWIPYRFYPWDWLWS